MNTQTDTPPDCRNCNAPLVLIGTIPAKGEPPELRTSECIKCREVIKREIVSLPPSKLWVS